MKLKKQEYTHVQQGQEDIELLVHQIHLSQTPRALPKVSFYSLKGCSHHDMQKSGHKQSNNIVFKLHHIIFRFQLMIAKYYQHVFQVSKIIAQIISGINQISSTRHMRFEQRCVCSDIFEEMLITVGLFLKNSHHQQMHKDDRQMTSSA
ncbi:unnamed protein product [Paramecium octaurelia]|uniref:Uncharacterized protein n=1 Tax=Paramecium octaurelia TaxID=43137 RepID=A0A8S1SED5_PAROT|nr:unnamed protein product [Paramecium octaurelia]